MISWGWILVENFLDLECVISHGLRGCMHTNHKPIRTFTVKAANSVIDHPCASMGIH